MLELKHITKVYEAGTTQVEALKGIDIENLSIEDVIRRALRAAAQQ